MDFAYAHLPTQDNSARAKDISSHWIDVYNIFNICFFKHRIIGILYTIVALTIMWIIIYITDLEYRFGWDKTHIYWRDWRDKFYRRAPELRIAFSEVTDIESGFIRYQGMKPKFMPFELIYFRSNDAHSSSEAIFVPSAFKYDYEVKEFLRYFYQIRSDIFPQEVVDFLNSDSPI